MQLHLSTLVNITTSILAFTQWLLQEVVAHLPKQKLVLLFRLLKTLENSSVRFKSLLALTRLNWSAILDKVSYEKVARQWKTVHPIMSVSWVVNCGGHRRLEFTQENRKYYI